MKKSFVKCLLFIIPLLIVLGCANNNDSFSSSSSFDDKSFFQNVSNDSQMINSLSNGNQATAPLVNPNTSSSESNNYSPNSQENSGSSQTYSLEDEIPFDGEYGYDEYYCAADQSIIRIFYYGYFQYKAKDKSFIVSYSKSNDYYVIENYFFVGSSEDNPSYQRDLLFFVIKNNELSLNAGLSINSEYYSINDKRYSFQKSYSNKEAQYFFLKETANNLLVDISFNGSFINSEQLLSSLDLLKYSEAVSSFSNIDNNGQIKFSFAIENFDIIDVLSQLVNTMSNEAITNITYRFDDYHVSSIPNIRNYGLNDQNVISDTGFTNIEEQLYLNNGNENCLYFKSYEEVLNYSNTLKQQPNGLKKYQETINYLENLDESVFLNSYLVFSKTLVKENSGVSYLMNNLYLKDNCLFIVLNKVTSVLYALGVESYSTFAILINNDIVFQKIETLS